MELSGRAQAPDWSRGRILSSRATATFKSFTDRSSVEMDSSWMAVRHRCAKLRLRSQLKPYQKESTHELYDCRG